MSLFTASEFETLSEDEFADFVSGIVRDDRQRDRAVDFLREDHPVYRERGTAAVQRMRGWILVSLAETSVPHAAILYLLEELDTAIHAYPVAAAAFALRSLPAPDESFAPFLLRAMMNIRYHDEPVCLDEYGEYPDDLTGTSAVAEIITTIRWMGPAARSIRSDLLQITGLSSSDQQALETTLPFLEASDERSPDADDCCRLPESVTSLFTWMTGYRKSCQPVRDTVFEDQDGNRITYGELLTGGPSVVVFFYTRCDNPLKCSLTITKLAGVQQELKDRGLWERVRTVAITYDPEYDNAQRLAQYGSERNVQTGPQHRLLRTTEGFDAIKKHFRLGVNYFGGFVNRHRVEVYLLDSAGDIAASFERIRWDEATVVEKAAEILDEQKAGLPKRASESVPGRWGVSALGSVPALGAAFFPKCPFCWAAYASVFGIAGLEQVPWSPWLYPVLVVALLVNLLSVWLRCLSTRRMAGLYFVVAGAIAVLAGSYAGWSWVPLTGVGLTFAGSLLSSLQPITQD